MRPTLGQRPASLSTEFIMRDGHGAKLCAKMEVIAGR